ncbi:MAG: hypothetical protein K2R98_24145 [Gemmataceae bacterium]|nr:hypothetical protein [Gemmataceae bacterium]
MHHHRFSDLLDMDHTPQPSEQPAVPNAFTLCPMAVIGSASAAQMMMMQELYRQALAEAQAVARPSILERDLLAVWN